MTNKKQKYIYGGIAREVSDASAVSGMLIKLFGGGFAFRVYTGEREFTDYQLRHDDLPITIDADSLASFYSVGDQHILDHSPAVLGLKKSDDET